jgi:hypothetical protein
VKKNFNPNIKIARHSNRIPTPTIEKEPKLKAKNKLIEAKIRKKQMEIDFLKKLKEIEGRLY